MDKDILSFQVSEEPNSGLTVVDNFEEDGGGPRAINYKAKAPTAAEIAKAEKLAREVFEELGLDYDKAKEENNG